MQPGAPPDRRNVECTADTGHAAEPDGTHHRREVRPRPVLERPVVGDALPIAFLHQRVAVEPPEPRDREHADDRQRGKHRGNQRTHGGPPVHRRDQHRHRRQRHQCEAVVQEDAPAEQEPGARSGHHRPPHRAPSGQRQQRDAPRGHACEIAVGGHRDPDGRRRHRDERRRQPGRVLVGQGAHRHHDRGRGAGPDQQAQQSRPRTAAQPDAVEPDERQQCARRMARHVRDPRIRLEIRDSAGERAHRFGNVGDGRHLAQVLVAARRADARSRAASRRSSPARTPTHTRWPR